MNERTQVETVSNGVGRPRPLDRFSDRNISDLTGDQGREWVLAYHEILPSPSKYRYRVTSAQFRSHLSQFASSASGITSGGPLPRITFDDGHRSNFELAFPMLEQSSLKATFFVLVGCLGKVTKCV